MNQENMFRSFQNSRCHVLISALDGIANEIRWSSLREAPDLMKYYNRKTFMALCVRATVQADNKFSFLSARHSGVKHDATAFSNTKLCDLLHGDEVPSWAAIIADDAYSKKSRVLTPYPVRHLTQREDTYNSYHSATRVCVEQAFGIPVFHFVVF